MLKTQNLLNGLRFASLKKCNENLVDLRKIENVLTRDKPAYVGMCILDLSKSLIYDFITIT